MTSDSAWRDQRRMAADEHAAALERRRAAETEQARALIAEFVREALARNLRTESLKATSHNGRSRYRTRVEGWYVRRNHSLGIGTDGQFYILSVPTNLRARLMGTHITPQDPPLEVGKGGRDGESIPLDELLHQRLDAGDDWA